MKNALILIMLLLSYSASATTYYISPSGSDSNNGSGSAPWKTLAYACTRATASGDIIHVNAGTYTETVQSVLAVGVSIEGAGVTSIIQSRVGGSSFTISLTSSSQGTNGNQHISNIKMDGSALTAYGAIKINRRGNVKIYNCTFINFNYYGVGFDGNGSGSQPSVYPTGNEFHHNTVINCSGYFPAGDKYNGEGKGAITVNGQDGLLIYNNTLDQTSRPPGSNGYLIKGVLGFNKGLKIYNNTITKAPYDNITWDFAIELWLCRGGIEIYDNVITSGIDISGGLDDAGISTQKGSYAYSLYIHDNEITQASLGPYRGIGIFVEQSAENVIIERNHIKNKWIGIYCPLLPKNDGTGKSFKDIRISYNIMENIGTPDGGDPDPGYGIFMPIYPVLTSGWTCNNVNIWNNVIVAHTGTIRPIYGIVLPAMGTTTNVSVRNNIVTGFVTAPVFGKGEAGVTLNYLSIENNIFYNNGNSNLPRYTSLTPAGNTTRNNIVSNPLFVSSGDFRLQSGSPAIGKGLTISGLTTDYAGNALKVPPSIGAYESGIAPIASPPPASPAIPAYQNSVVENISPTKLDITYNLNLANIIPATSSFIVLVNSMPRTVKSISISLNKVQLTLESAIKFGDIITISYTKPSTNPLQSTAGGQATSLSSKSVINNCKEAVKANAPPVVLINYPETVNSGFVSKIDASSSFDPDNDPLIVEWTITNEIPVSTLKSFKTEFLAPVVENSETVNFKLVVSDGISIQSKDFPILVLPYKPELSGIKVTDLEASDFETSDLPENILDGNTTTKWSSNGDNQWLVLKLAEPCKISHLVMAFLKEQTYESYFDIYASKDKISWDPILTSAASCKFSGRSQIFDFPSRNTETEYSFLKYVAHGNSLNYQNAVSEIKIFGTPQEIPKVDNIKKTDLVIYPNPARDFFNIAIGEPSVNPNSIRIIDYSGKVVFEDSYTPDMVQVILPDSIYSGIYIVEFRSGSVIIDAQKLIVRKN